MTRILAGAAKGKRLITPSGIRTRPTSEKARAALFSSLLGLLDVRGARVLDLYAGSGAVGLEALSRGASHALLVESDPHSLRVIERNVKEVGLSGARVARSRVERVVSAPPADGPYELVFADPPYRLKDSDLDNVLVELLRHSWMAEDAILVVERSSRGDAPSWPAEIELIKNRRYGEGTLWYGRRM